MINLYQNNTNTSNNKLKFKIESQQMVNKYSK